MILMVLTSKIWLGFIWFYISNFSVNQFGSNVISRNDSPINFFDSTDNELFLTGVQLEIGQNATEFEHEPFEKTLAKCQRIFMGNR